VVEHLRAGVDDSADSLRIALKIGDEHFNAAAGSLAANLVNHHGEGAGAAEEIVVAIDAGNDCVFEAKCGYGFGDATGLVEINELGTAFGYSAEAATARAEVAEHHECCGLVVPALADVGTVSALADGVEIEGTGKALEAVEVLAHGSAGLEPLGLGSRGEARGGDLD
jgi:hypothetical protein